MAYDYNPESSRFEVANPHRVENAFLGLIALICAGGAVAALLMGRGALQASLTAGAIRPILVAVALLSFAVLFGGKAMSQLRFFFGRNQPAKLSPQDRVDSANLPEGEWLKDTLRQNSIAYPIPTGPLNTLLYTLFKDLVFAPAQTQNYARIEFSNTVTLAFLLLCCLVSMLGVGSVAVREWVSFFYFALTVVLVIAPFRRGELRAKPMPLPLFIGMIVSAVIAPVLLPYLIGNHASPFHRWIQLPAVTVVVIGSALSASLLFMAAAVAQMVKPNRIMMAQHLQALSMNAPPNQIFIEFDREMQRAWTERIPNRVYLRHDPITEGDSGAFSGQAIEETQPVPQDNEPLTLGRCASLATYRWLLLLDVLALALAAIGAGMLVFFAATPNGYGALVMGGSLLTIASVACFGGSRLWRRFEFTSRITWLQCEGNFTRAKSSIGALLQDRVKTEKSLVNVEDMTLRVWVAEVDSVSFGPDVPRSLLSIRGLPDEAERLSSHLAHKAREQAMVVAPQSQADLQRLAVLNQVNPASAAPLPTAAAALLGAGAVGAPANPVATHPKFCAQCGAALLANARFCAQCGTAAAG